MENNGTTNNPTDRIEVYRLPVIFLDAYYAEHGTIHVEETYRAGNLATVRLGSHGHAALESAAYWMAHGHADRSVRRSAMNALGRLAYSPREKHAKYVAEFGMGGAS